MFEMKTEWIRAQWISRRRSSPEVLRRRRPGPHADAFLDAMQPGDEIRTFTNSAQAWQAKMGRRGYVLLRKGQLVRVLLTAMN